MIRHVVLIRFEAATPDDERERVISALRALRDSVPGMLAFAAGANTSVEGLDRGYTHAFSIDFDSEAARDAYLEHPDHKAAGARLVALAGGIDRILVVDFAF